MFALPFFLTSVEIVESVKEKKLITNGLLANQKWFWYLHKNRFGFKFLGFLHLAISLENYANLLCALKNGIFITFVVETKKANLQIFIKRNLESKSPI